MEQIQAAIEALGKVRKTVLEPLLALDEALHALHQSGYDAARMQHTRDHAQAERDALHGQVEMQQQQLADLHARFETDSRDLRQAHDARMRQATEAYQHQLATSEDALGTLKAEHATMAEALRQERQDLEARTQQARTAYEEAARELEQLKARLA